MKRLSSDIYRKLELLSDQVKGQLKKKGIVVPLKNDDESISLGHYTIVKRDNFYIILDYAGEVVVDKINLPQSAILIANNLALGKLLDNNTLNLDRCYGYAEFEEQLHLRMAEKNLKKDIDRADVLFAKSKVNHDKKVLAKHKIFKSFEKLRNFA